MSADGRATSLALVLGGVAINGDTLSNDGDAGTATPVTRWNALCTGLCRTGVAGSVATMSCLVGLNSDGPLTLTCVLLPAEDVDASPPCMLDLEGGRESTLALSPELRHPSWEVDGEPEEEEPSGELPWRPPCRAAPLPVLEDSKLKTRPLRVVLPG